MRKIYLDRTKIPGNTVLIVRDAEVISTGATISSMPISCKDPEYKRYADEYDIHFIFDDALPQVEFYTVPLLDIFATDSNGGFFASIGEFFDLDGPVYYIDGNHNCFYITDNGKQFISNAQEWKYLLKPYAGIEFFNSREDAIKNMS